MARMHTRKHGKSKSRKPVLEEGAKVTDVTKDEVEKLVESYAKQAMSPELIGEKLKRDHKVPYIKHIMGKRLLKIMKDKGLWGDIPPDLLNLMKKAVNLHSHLDRNKHDVHNTMRLKRIEAKIWRLTKYYMREGVLPQGWRYDPERAALMIKGK